jgi:hypothetical protein
MKKNKLITWQILVSVFLVFSISALSSLLNFFYIRLEDVEVIKVVGTLLFPLFLSLFPVFFALYTEEPNVKDTMLSISVSICALALSAYLFLVIGLLSPFFVASYISQIPLFALLALVLTKIRLSGVDFTVKNLLILQSLVPASFLVLTYLLYQVERQSASIPVVDFFSLVLSTWPSFKEMILNFSFITIIVFPAIFALKVNPPKVVYSLLSLFVFAVGLFGFLLTSLSEDSSGMIFLTFPFIITVVVLLVAVITLVRKSFYSNLTQIENASQIVEQN